MFAFNHSPKSLNENVVQGAAHKVDSNKTLIDYQRLTKFLPGDRVLLNRHLKLYRFVKIDTGRYAGAAQIQKTIAIGPYTMSPVL